MLKNMNRSYGLYNSQRVLLALTGKGMSREDAYELVQRNAMQSWKKGIEFKKLLLNDKEVKKHLSSKEIKKSSTLNITSRMWIIFSRGCLGNLKTLKGQKTNTIVNDLRGS